MWHKFPTYKFLVSQHLLGLWCLVAWAYSATALLLSHHLNVGYPMVRFLAGESDRFRDFIVQLSNGSGIQSLTFNGFEILRGGFPGGAILYYHLGPSVGLSVNQGIFVYQVVVLALLAVGLYVCFDSILAKVAVALSFPVFFGLFRGNNDVVVFALYLIGMGLCKRGEARLGFVSKWLGQLIEPNFLLFEIIRSTSRRLLFAGFVLFAGVTALTNLLAPTFRSPIKVLWSSVQFSLTQGPQSANFLLTHNIGLVAGIEAWFQLIYQPTSMQGSVFRVQALSVLVVVLSLLVLIHAIRTTSLTDADRLLLITCLLVLTPTLSYWYRSIWLLIPLGYLLDKGSRNEISRYDLAQAAIIMMTVVPKNWLVFESSGTSSSYYESTLIDPFLILALLIVTLVRYQHKSSPCLQRIKPVGIRRLKA